MVHPNANQTQNHSQRTRVQRYAPTPVVTGWPVNTTYIPEFGTGMAQIPVATPADALNRSFK